MSSPGSESDKEGSTSAVSTPCDVNSLKSLELDSTAPSVPVAMPQFCAGAGTQAAELLRDASSSHRQQCQLRNTAEKSIPAQVGACFLHHRPGWTRMRRSNPWPYIT